MNMINIAKLLKDLEEDFDLDDIPARKAKLHRAFYYHNQGWQKIPAAQHAKLVERLNEMKDYENEWYKTVFPGLDEDPYAMDPYGKGLYEEDGDSE